MSTPLVRAVGTLRRIAFTSRRAGLSKTMNWPLRGRTVKPGSAPRSRSTRSPKRPAAFTHDPGPEATGRGGEPPGRTRAVGGEELGAGDEPCAVPYRLGDVAEGRAPGVDDALAGDEDGAPGVAVELRLALEKLVRLDETGVGGAVALGEVADRGEARAVLGGPGDDEGAGLEQRQVHAGVDRR